MFYVIKILVKIKRREYKKMNIKDCFFCEVAFFTNHMIEFKDKHLCYQCSKKFLTIAEIWFNNHVLKYEVMKGEKNEKNLHGFNG